MRGSTGRMRGVGWMLLLAVVPVLSACGDAPAAPGMEVASRDLEFVLPEVRRMPAVVTQQVGETRASHADAGAAGFADAGSGSGTVADSGDGTMGLIFSKYLTSGFQGDTYSFEYGLFGFGTSYSMRPTYRVTSGGRVVIEETGVGREESIWQVPIFMRPSARESLRIDQTCGALANVSVNFTVRVDNDAGAGWHSSANGLERASTSQPGCPASGGGGGGTSESTKGLKICYWEISLDLNGVVSEVLFLGCYSLGPNAT